VSDTPYLFCLYAEDVRQEMSGQISIIGAFQGGLRVGDVPTRLDKLTIIANLRLPGATEPTSVKLQVLRGVEVLQTIEPTADFLQSVTEEGTSRSGEERMMQFVVGFVDFPILDNAKIEVRATINGLALQGNPLEITVNETDP